MLMAGQEEGLAWADIFSNYSKKGCPRVVKFTGGISHTKIRFEAKQIIPGARFSNQSQNSEIAELSFLGFKTQNQNRVRL